MFGLWQKVLKRVFVVNVVEKLRLKIRGLLLSPWWPLFVLCGSGIL